MKVSRLFLSVFAVIVLLLAADRGLSLVGGGRLGNMAPTGSPEAAGAVGPAGPAGLPGSPGPIGPAGPSGAPGISTATVAGTVTNSLTGKGVAGVTFTPDPAISGVSIKTDDSGKFSATLPTGSYTLAAKRDNFTSATMTVSLVAGQTVTKDMALKPVSPVALSAGGNLTSSPGGTVTLTAKAEPLDGSQVTAYKWTQTAGVPLTIRDADKAIATVIMGDLPASRRRGWAGAPCASPATTPVTTCTARRSALLPTTKRLTPRPRATCSWGRTPTSSQRAPAPPTPTSRIPAPPATWS